MQKTFYKNSSGDLLADRRYDLARDLLENGDAEAALDLVFQAEERATDWPVLPFFRGEILMKLDRPDEAAVAFQAYLALDPADMMGAALKLALLKAGPSPQTLPAAYVETLFDDYAARFDKALVESLGYCVPRLLVAAVQGASSGPATYYGTILDLGCGTGLSGEVFAPHAGQIDGIDLSANMLAEARHKNIYNRLIQGDITQQMSVLTPRFYDLVVAADVLVYIGALEELFKGVSCVLKTEGLFAFSTQKQDKQNGFSLQPDHRYAHGRQYLQDMIEAAGMQIISLTEDTLRQDAGQDVKGYIVVARPHAKNL